MHSYPALIDLRPICEHCGMRRGLHQYDTENCPNRQWRAGNGHSQWLTSAFQIQQVQPSREQA